MSVREDVLLESVQMWMTKNKELRAKNKELRAQLRRMRAERDRLRAAINWALGGPGSDFPPRKEGQGQFWWRMHLAVLADYDAWKPRAEGD